MTFCQVDEPTLTSKTVSVVSVDGQCGCVHYLKRVLVMPENVSVGEAKGTYNLNRISTSH